VNLSGNNPLPRVYPSYNTFHEIAVTLEGRRAASSLRLSKREALVFAEGQSLVAAGIRSLSILGWRISGMRFVVTGGAGFIGSNTVDELVRRGHSVVVLDDLSTGKEENLAEIRNKITLIKGSITDIEVVRKAMHEAEYVLHLAARTSVPKSVKDPIETNRVNIDGTLNVLVAARDAKVKRFVFAASSSAYGETPTLPKAEKMVPQPISPYGVTKYVGELYAQTFGRCYGLENVSLRYFNIFGPRQDPGSPYSGVLAKFCSAFLEETQPVIFGDGEQTRDFTYVDNAVQANLLACEAPNVSGKTFNVGIGGRVSLNETLGLLNKISGHNLEAKYEPGRDGDIRDSQADISQIREFLGYEPVVGFEEGLRRTFEWYRATQAKANAAPTTASVPTPVPAPAKS
jgi:nucleoside-diphosphate-sugar epimerase